MNEGIKSVKTGQVTFSIKDTNIDGVDIKKDDYMGIVDKNIICCNPDKVESAFQAVKAMVDDFSSIITNSSSEVYVFDKEFEKFFEE